MKKRLISVLGAVIFSCSILFAIENEKPKKEKVKYGKVSYYGGKFHGRKTANGEIYNKNKLTAAVPLNGKKPSLPFGTKVRITNPKNGKTVIVTINDTGGFAKYGRTFDLSEGAMRELGGVQSGVLNVFYEVINPLEKYQKDDTIYDAPRKPKYIYLAEEQKKSNEDSSF